MEIEIIDKKSPIYNFCDMKINAKFGTLFINFKCETIMELMDFIKIDSEKK